MTPDANPLLGPIAGVRGFWLAAGLSLNGFGGAGGIGQALAGWITAGDPGLDIGPCRAWRFGPTYRDPGYTAALARETYADYYRLRYPYDADEAGRPRRLSPLHGRQQDAGAVFGTKAGWERADHYEPEIGWRRSGRDQRAFGYTEPPWFGRVVAEGRSVRERVGLIDLTSFGKLEVEGPGALGLLQGVCANDVDRPVGRVTYSQWLDARGGIVADVTVTRLAETRFRVVTGSASVTGDLAWLEAAVAAMDARVSLREVSDEWACIGLWGPMAREVLATVSDDDVTDVAIPPRTARIVRVAQAPVLASRISYAGELGWELTIDRGWAATVWDALVRAGVDRGIRPIGYRALDGLRMEKGYRAMGTDLTMLETPLEAGLGAFVRMDHGPFIGREALLEQLGREPRGPVRRLRTLVAGGEAYLPIYGGEAVRLGDEVVGRLRSVAHGPPVRGPIAYALGPATLSSGVGVTIDVFDGRLEATVSVDVLVDPAGERMRG
jgi:4-methylaminobutanoate oxidase (formaldehyde-forming)